MSSSQLISEFLAHSMVFFTREELSPNGIVDDARNGGDPPAPSTQQSMGDVLQAYAQYLPDILRVARQEVGPTEAAFQASKEVTAPQQAELDARLYETYAPRFAASSAKTEADLLGTYGAQNVRNAAALQREVDQPYFTAREQAGGKLGELLAGLDPNKLTEGESSEIERNLNRARVSSGDNRNPDNTSVISAAQTFGSGLQAKRDAVSRAIDNAVNFMNSSRTGVDTFAQATGRSGTQAYGQQAYTSQPGANQAFGTASNVFGQTAAMQAQRNDINSQRRDSLDRSTQVLSSLPNIS